MDRQSDEYRRRSAAEAFRKRLISSLADAGLPLRPTPLAFEVKSLTGRSVGRTVLSKFLSGRTLVPTHRTVQALLDVADVPLSERAELHRLIGIAEGRLLP